MRWFTPQATECTAYLTYKGQLTDNAQCLNSSRTKSAASEAVEWLTLKMREYEHVAQYEVLKND